MDFQDSCRAAKINKQTLKPASPIYGVDKTEIAVLTFDAFTDTVDDAANSYAKGICGEKLMVLESSNLPKFIRL